jgi:hypothetical protein
MRTDWQQIVALFILGIPIACVARTVVFEEIFKEPREYCKQKSEVCRGLLTRKFFYLFTCEYCFSHWVTLAFMWMTGYHLLFEDWRGWVIGFFSLVFVSNLYLNLYSRLRIELTSEKVDIKAKEKHIERLDAEVRTAEEMNADGSPVRAAMSPAISPPLHRVEPMPPSH